MLMLSNIVFSPEGSTLQASLSAIRLESDQLNRIFLAAFNKHPGTPQNLKLIYQAIFVQQELGEVVIALKKQASDQTSKRIHKVNFPLKALAQSKDFQRTKKFLALQTIQQKFNKLDVRIVKAFRIWQKILLDRYLDLLSSKMRQTKKSILHQRFLFISKKVLFKMRRAFLKWAALCLGGRN